MAKYTYLCQRCSLEQKGESDESAASSDAITLAKTRIDGGDDIPHLKIVKYDGKVWKRVNLSPSKARQCRRCGEKREVLLRRPKDGDIELDDNLYFEGDTTNV